MASKFMNDIMNNNWVDIKETLEKVTAKKIVSRINEYKKEFRRRGSFE